VGDACDGWHLLKRGEMSVIQERVPAGRAEVIHYHQAARQFFFILDGEGTMVFEDREGKLQKGSGLEILPGVHHQFCNKLQSEVYFLAISVPSTRQNRVNL